MRLVSIEASSRECPDRLELLSRLAIALNEYSFCAARMGRMAGSGRPLDFRRVMVESMQLREQYHDVWRQLEEHCADHGCAAPTYL